MRHWQNLSLELTIQVIVISHGHTYRSLATCRLKICWPVGPAFWNLYGPNIKLLALGLGSVTTVEELTCYPWVSVWIVLFTNQFSPCTSLQLWSSSSTYFVKNILLFDFSTEYFYVQRYDYLNSDLQLFHN